ncbi:class I SAM-dependent methyltransferase [Caulobacter sp. RL271]|uniref:50S ribosomal protein L11 methyltransferase n=1 Tax=Caulobacter segnis TaxID=88688 RepID=A0ABY4ZPE6_9CAUL|nr:50S ribosomal protein L11 methyltransferase [Caulobacter segnis]USQ94673.1 50S ribosomal protein L11 methyltransferase [Caulobacter segnis]
MTLEAFIQARLTLEPVPGVPEVRLHRAGPRSGLMRLAEADPDFGSPYWARPWGGGLALARYVLDRPDVVAGKRVLDLGAGSGLVAIAAALAGAGEVRAVDVDSYAVAAARLNAAANGVTMEVAQTDLLDGDPPDAELMLVGDLFYDPALAARVELFLRRCLAAGIAVLIGDPWRAPLPADRLRVVAEYPVADFGDPNGATRAAAVFELEG